MLKVIDGLKTRVLLSITLITAVTLGIGFAYPGVVRAQGNDEAAVRDALLKSATSFEKNDLALASQVWANDEALTVFEQGHANYGWADYRDNHLVPEMAEIKNTKYQLTDIKVHLAGKTAWATFKYTISGDVTENSKARHVDGGGLGTAVLENREGRWQILHWHSSAPRRAPAPSPSPADKH
ncbi:MAG TPA: nuclear transport factor 2 family protein [Pyrinomonadaceae bacterium]|jgi:ketosteroid isomerase-like protein